MLANVVLMLVTGNDAKWFFKGENRPILVSSCLEYCLILVVALHVVKTNFLSLLLCFALVCVSPDLLFLTALLYWALLAWHYSHWKASQAGKLDLKKHCNVIFFSFSDRNYILSLAQSNAEKWFLIQNFSTATVLNFCEVIAFLTFIFKHSNRSIVVIEFEQ